MKKAFRIDWRIDIDASSPQEAAFLASEVQSQNNISTATVFSVEDKQTGEITVLDLGLDGRKGENPAARMPADTMSRRSLRRGVRLRSRNDFEAEVVSWDNGDPHFPLTVKLACEDGGAITGQRTKSGLHPQAVSSGKPHPLDIVEANPTIIVWVRVYDRPPLNEAGKQIVSGKEFAAERCLHWYVFSSEEKARANLRGVRAVFKLEYVEGEGISI